MSVGIVPLRRWIAELKSQGTNIDPEELESEAADMIDAANEIEAIQTIQEQVNSENDWLHSHPLQVPNCFVSKPLNNKILC